MERKTIDRVIDRLAPWYAAAVQPTAGTGPVRFGSVRFKLPTSKAPFATEIDEQLRKKERKNEKSWA